MSVRKRTWKTAKGETKEAWVVSYSSAGPDGKLGIGEYDGKQCSASRGPSGGVIVSSCCAARAPGMVDVTLLQRFIEHMRKSDTCSAQLQRDIGFGLIHIGGVNMLRPAR